MADATPDFPAISMVVAITLVYVTHDPCWLVTPRL